MILSGDNWPFTEPPGDCSMDQRHLIMMHREVKNAIQICHTKGCPVPKEDTFKDYETFRKWLNWLDKAQARKPGQDDAQYGWVRRK